MRISDWSSDVCSSDLVRAVCSKVAQIPTQSRAGGRITVSIDRTIEGRGYRRAIGLFDDGGNGPAREAEIIIISGNAFGAQIIAFAFFELRQRYEIGRASCRERVCQSV